MKSFSELTSASQVNNGDLLAISQTSGSGYASKKTTVKDITDKSNLNLAEEYDSTSTYAVDDYVIYESVLYKCIGTTTGTFDSTKWTSVVVTDEMGSGGGGGTGGHTIIDENGNSMTARAGLQFVGGANVSDDSTNNKTIVDLASAGGIDGVFVDTGNVIQSATAIPNGTSTYTATEDCIVAYQLVATESGCNIQINDNIVDGLLTGSNYNVVSGNAYLKKGQVIKFVQTSTDAGTYTVYGIQTGTTHSKFQPVIYSLEEREIGVWTDGKPLYVRTYNVTFSSNYTDVTIDSTHEVKLLDGGIDSNANDNFIHLGYGTSQNDMCGAYEYEAGKIRFQNFYYSSRPNGWLNVYYTKSTDVAGSGSWTPQGVPTHHYSTDEQIIGTWVDGKTLYEKTIDCGNISASTGKSIAHNISNFGRLVSYDIVALNTAENRWNGIPRVDNDASYQRGFGVDGTNITISQSNNAQALTNCYATIRYTKSS